MQYEPLSKIFYKNNPAYEAIYQQRFNHECTQRYNFFIGDTQAFAVIQAEILNLITSILQLDKRLLQASNSVPPIALTQFTRKCIVDEVQLTNEIEGVHSTRKEIRELLPTAEDTVVAPKRRRRLYGLVQKYMMLSDGQLIELKTCQDIRKLYNEFVLAEIEAENRDNVPDGSIFRKDIVEVVSPTQKVIHKGLYPEDKIIAAMTAALDIVHDERLNYFIRIAIFHYMFGYIHPFYDGNGRMARFISSYLLNQQLEAIVGFGLSYTIKHNIKKYYDLFKETNDYKNKGDLTPFIIGFLALIKEAVENLCITMEGKGEQLYFYVGKIKVYQAANKKVGDILYVLVQNALFDDEGMDIQSLANASEIGVSTVRACLKKIPQEVLVITQVGKMNLYSVNLEALSQGV